MEKRRVVVRTVPFFLVADNNMLYYVVEHVNRCFCLVAGNNILNMLSIFARSFKGEWKFWCLIDGSIERVW